MQLFSVCVINAFLVEEFDYRLTTESDEELDRTARVDRTNPLGTPRVLFNKFKGGQVKRENLPFTFLMASSPLLLGLLSEQDVPKEFIAKISPPKTNQVDQFCKISSWLKLQVAFVAGSKHAGTTSAKDENS